MNNYQRPHSPFENSAAQRLRRMGLTTEEGSPERDDGTLEAIFRALSADADMENLSVDSACIKVHESANGGGKLADKAVGRTRGRLNTKLHSIVDGLGNPVEFMLFGCVFSRFRLHCRYRYFVDLDHPSLFAKQALISTLLRKCGPR